jgi:hypothetical protein
MTIQSFRDQRGYRATHASVGSWQREDPRSQGVQQGRVKPVANERNGRQLISPASCLSSLLSSRTHRGKSMKNTKFVVKVNRGGTRYPEYVLRIDRTPIQTTTSLRLALVMGRFTAEDAVKSIQNSRCSPELVSVLATRRRFIRLDS